MNAKYLNTIEQLLAFLEGAPSPFKLLAKRVTVKTCQIAMSDNESNEAQTGLIAGFSLHAGIMARRDQRKKLEIRCRYICRLAVSEKRLAMKHSGRIRYEVKGFTNVACAGMRRCDQLKTPYRDGTTHVFFRSL